MAETSTVNSRRRPLPVVRWLQVGATAAGLGMAIVASPAVACADDGGGPSVADRADRPTVRAGASVHRAPGRQGSSADTSANSATDADGRRGGGAPIANQARLSAQTTVTRAAADSALDEAKAADSALDEAKAPAKVPVAASAVRVTPSVKAAAAAPAAPVVAAATGPTTAAVTASASAVAQAKSTAQSTPSAAPGLGAFSATARLNLEDLFSGTGKPVVTNPTAVVTGLFREMLRRDPTATELQNYLNRLKLLGVNGVVAGLYTSDAFRQNAVNNYYLEILGRVPTQQELSSGALRLTFGTEPGFAASLAGTQAFYNSSAEGGGKFGTQPSATTYVNLLYRSLLGQTMPPNSVDPLVTQIQAGLSIARAATQFVNADPYRTVKVAEVYQVLDQPASQQAIDQYVKNWIWSGGQSGISMSLLATAVNVQRMEAGLVTMPDVAAAAVLQTLLLAPYIDGPTGFNAQYKELVGDCSDTSAPACKNPNAYALIKSGGLQRGIPNVSISSSGVAATVATLVPTQNEINLKASLDFPLQHSDALAVYFKGGTIDHPNGPVITANGGTYIVDGHHRWSAIYLINPNTKVSGIDLGYVASPQDALRESQFGIVATTGVLKESAAGEPNIYDVSREVFDVFVRDTILGATAPEPANVIATFGQYISTPTAWAGLTDAQKMTEIQNYIWANVLRMREQNPYIPDAPSRVVMPQFGPILPTVQNLDSGLVSYSFPTISYLG